MLQKSDFKILIADDDDITRDMLVSLLSKEGYPVVAAKDGLEAKKILMREDIKLVIADYRMPGGDGIEVLKHAIRNSPDIAVVILTAYGTLDSVLEAMKEGAYDYVTKPFKVQEIILLAERAYKRAVLIEDNRELIKHLRETYRDIEVIKAVSDSRNPEITTGWIERIERLKEVNVLTAQEADMLRERLIKGGVE
jgi:DNA-binding NtrC family response regulator